MRQIIFLVFIALCLGACKKSKIKSVNTNNTADSLSYQPFVPDSKWTYEFTLMNVSKSNYDVVRLNYDSTINGHVYNVFNDGKQGLQFYRQDGKKYYSVLTTAANLTEVNHLDASKNVGESWSSVNGSDTYTYTMAEKFTTYVVDGFTFNNVLKVSMQRTDGNDNNKVTMSGDTFYAQGVGMIISDGKVGPLDIDIKVLTVDLK